MIVYIIFFIAFVAIIVSVIFETISEKRHRELIQGYMRAILQPMNEIKEEPFSVSEYYKRLEKYSLSLQSEKESRNLYLITLWWGFDGLRLNEDGTTTWINRKPKLIPEPDYYAQQNMNRILPTPSYQIGCQVQSLQSQIFQQQQTIQMQNMINQLNPSIYPAYISQPTIGQLNPLYNPLSWTCCGSMQNAVQNKTPDT